jgi:hypothetical protein
MWKTNLCCQIKDLNFLPLSHQQMNEVQKSYTGYSLSGENHLKQIALISSDGFRGDELKKVIQLRTISS